MTVIISPSTCHYQYITVNMSLQHITTDILLSTSPSILVSIHYCQYTTVNILLSLLLSTYYHQYHHQYITINILLSISMSTYFCHVTSRASGKFLNTSLLYKNAADHSPLSHTTQDPKHPPPCSNQRLQPGPCRTSTRTR